MVEEFWQYAGVPTDSEIIARREYDRANYDKLAIRHECPSCGSIKTMWIRQEWSVCFNCLIPFTLDEYLDYRYFQEEQYGRNCC